jgi:hypothetical protein
MTNLTPYSGNRSFKARQAAWTDGQQRFFVNPNGWADIRYATVEALAKLLEPSEYRIGKGGTGFQVRFTAEVLAKLGYEFPGMPVELAGSVGEDITDFMLRKAASK